MTDDARMTFRTVDEDGLTPEDRSHLELLMICHYVMAALALMGCLFLGAYAIFLPSFLGSMTEELERSGGNVEGMEMFDSMMPMFIAIFAVIALIQTVSTVLHFLCARNLKARRGRTLCQVVAALALFSIPLGTALGIFTLVVLARPTVRDAFD